MEEKRIKDILGITDTYEFIQRLNDILPQKEKREYYMSRVLENGADISTDFIRDIYQSEMAQRKQLKQDYTPATICKLFYEVSENKEGTILDECAGTGSLVIEYIAHGYKNVICIEKSEAVFPLLLFNMAIRNVSGYVIKEDITTQEIYQVYILTSSERFSNIIKAKHLEDIKADLIISNPPYSLPWSGKPDNRFLCYPIPPRSKGDYLFIIDILTKLKKGGEAYILLPHGVLFRGQSEGEIRKELIESGRLQGIIGLPGNMFLNTQIPTVLLCFSNKDRFAGVYIMDASGYAKKDKKTNTFTDDAIKNIANAYKGRKEIAKVARLVTAQEIRGNDYNLNIPRYIDTFELEEICDLKETVASIMSIDREIRKTEKELAETMKQLVGENYKQDIAEVLKLWS